MLFCRFHFKKKKRSYSTWFSLPKRIALWKKFETDLYVRYGVEKLWLLGSENHLPYVYPTKCSAATPKQTAEARWKQRERKQTNRSIWGFWIRWPSLLHKHKQKFETPNLPSGCIRRRVHIQVHLTFALTAFVYLPHLLQGSFSLLFQTVCMGEHGRPVDEEGG